MDTRPAQVCLPAQSNFQQRHHFVTSVCIHSHPNAKDCDKNSFEGKAQHSEVSKITLRVV